MSCTADFGALSIIYFVSADFKTPSMRFISLSRMSARSVDKARSERINTASLSRIVSKAARPLASKVAPEDTKSQMLSAIPMEGASSTAPFISTKVAAMPVSDRYFPVTPG